LVELYNSISDNEAIYNEESSNILVKTEETKEIIADAEKLEQAVIAEKEKEEEVKAEEVVQEKQSETVAEEPKEEKEETTDEAAGFQGQTEVRHFDIRLSGDFDRDRPTSDNDAAAVKNVLKNAGIEAEVQPSEADFSSVSINTMAQPEAVMNALGDMVDESLEYKDELSEEKK
jgi:hypothetical protein